MLFHIRKAKRISFPQGPSQVSEWFWWLAICWFPHSTVLAVLFEVLREYGAYVVPLYLHHLLEQQWTECSFLLHHLTGSWLDNLLYAQISIYLFTYPSTRERAQGFSTASAREFILGTRSDPFQGSTMTLILSSDLHEIMSCNFCRSTQRGLYGLSRKHNCPWTPLRTWTECV